MKNTKKRSKYFPAQDLSPELWPPLPREGSGIISLHIHMIAAKIIFILSNTEIVVTINTRGKLHVTN